MAKWKSSDCGFFLIAGNNILGTTSKIDESCTHALSETTPLGVSAEAYDSSGVKDPEFTQEGWFDDAVGSIHDAMATLPAANAVMMFAPTGNVLNGKLIAAGTVLRVGYNRQVVAKEVQKANGIYNLSSVREEGIIVATLTNRSTAGNTQAGYADLGAAVSNGGAAYLGVTLVTGSPTTLICSVQHSTDHVSWVSTLATFVGNITGISSQRVGVAGTINRYLAITWSWTGGTTPTATFVVGVTTNP